MNSVIRLKQTVSILLVTFVIACFALSPGAQALNNEGDIGNGNTVEGLDALGLVNVTTAGFNSAFGWFSLYNNVTPSFNTGVGAATLFNNNAGTSNTAVGTAAMFFNTGGSNNTAVGTNALRDNDGGSSNDAVGAFALFSNINGFSNNAFGGGALQSNLSASSNTAVGAQALFSNDNTGSGFASENTAVGAGALVANIDGDSNTAVGAFALDSENATGGYPNGVSNNAIGRSALSLLTTGSFNQAIGVNALFDLIEGVSNVAIGDNALELSDGSYNTAVGFAVGENLALATSSENIYIGDSAGTLDFLGNSPGDEIGVIRIGSSFSGTNACFINGIANNGPFTDTVTIDPATGQLGGLPSSARFKKDIKPMDKTSEAIYSLKPVIFHYKKDKTNTPWFGLIAEDVAKVNPALIGVDSEGKPYCVAYDKVNAMLLNEFLKEHRTVQEQGATIARLEKQVEMLTAGLRKVSAQLELNKAAPQTVLNDR